MGVKILKLNIFRGSTSRHALFRALIIVSALSLVPLMELLPGIEVTSKTRVSGDDAVADLVALGRFVFPGTKLFLNNLVEPFLGKLETKKFPEAIMIADIGEAQLPKDCQSVKTNRPYIEFMEPPLEQKPVDFPNSVAYLPKFLDLSLKKRLVYIDIGAADHLYASLTPDWFLPSYPIDRKAFSVYFVDNNTSVMLWYVKRPGVTFVYHLDLAVDNATGENRTPFEQLEPFPEDDEGFDFLAWFEETAKNADFVVLKMNTSQVEMKFLSVLWGTGAICYVDELFLRCSSHKPDCISINILRTLRNRGVFVHQWWQD